MNEYKEIEQDPDVPRGYCRLTQVIAYFPIPGRTKGDRTKDSVLIPWETANRAEFFQTREQVEAYKKSCPDARFESFNITLTKTQAKIYMERKSE